MKKSVILAAAALVASGAFAEIRAVTPDMYGGNTNAWQLKRHALKMREAATNDPQVVFIGDSITELWDCKGEFRGNAQWKRYLAGEPYRALNLGICGDRTEHVLWRLTEGRELDGYSAKCILLMIGTNNSGHFQFADEPPMDTICGIRRILRVIRQKQPKAKVVLTAIFPRGRDDADPIRRRNEVVNASIAAFADGKDVFWCDLNDQFLTPDGVLPRDVMDDRLHPGPYGYEVWFAAVKPYLDYALSDGRLPAPPNRFAACARATRFGVDAPVTMRPVSRADGWWHDRVLEKRNQIVDSKGEIDLVFLGDSITHNWEKRAPSLLEELRKTYSVLDIGFSGDRTEHVLWRIENGHLDGYRAKAIMLMIGINNTWHRKDDAGDIALGIKAILDKIAEKQPQARVLLLPIFPCGDSPTEAKRVNNEKVNALIKGYADGERVLWVDFRQKFLDAQGNTKWIMPDCIHPSFEGYRDVWLPSVMPYFRKIVGK